MFLHGVTHELKVVLRDIDLCVCVQPALMSLWLEKRPFSRDAVARERKPLAHAFLAQ